MARSQVQRVAQRLGKGRFVSVYWHTARHLEECLALRFGQKVFGFGASNDVENSSPQVTGTSARVAGSSSAEEQDRIKWVERLEGRFPSLTGRVATLAVPGGVSHGSLHDEKTQQLFRQRVKTLLGLDKGDAT